MSDTVETLMTSAEVLKWLKVSKFNLHKLREKGLPHFKLADNSLRYRKSEVEQWLESKRVH